MYLPLYLSSNFIIAFRNVWNKPKLNNCSVFPKNFSTPWTMETLFQTVLFKVKFHWWYTVGCRPVWDPLQAITEIKGIKFGMLREDYWHLFIFMNYLSHIYNFNCATVTVQFHGFNMSIQKLQRLSHCESLWIIISPKSKCSILRTKLTVNCRWPWRPIPPAPSSWLVAGMSGWRWRVWCGDGGAVVSLAERETVGPELQLFINLETT